ncbi:reverse transcriptase [Trichonephila clavipes]|nr:reverse transcriptase [Trichonephila clavipes]
MIPLQFYSAIATALPSKRLNLNNLTSNKADALPEELKSCALKTIKQRYSVNEWLHIYTHGSYQPEKNGAGTGGFCWLFEGSFAVEKNIVTYDCEVLSVCEATAQLLAAGLAPAKVVLYIDSQAAILALSSDIQTDCFNTIKCRTKIAELMSYGWTVGLLWIPGHVGIPGNERAGQKVKQGAESSQPEVPLTFRRAKSIISTFIDKYTIVTQKTKCLGKPWETLAIVGPIPRHLERAEAVASFCLNTGYEFLGVYLHWFGMAANEVCSLCDHVRMHGNHLLQYTGLDEYSTDDIDSRYWEDRHRMVKNPITGIG